MANQYFGHSKEEIVRKVWNYIRELPDDEKNALSDEMLIAISGTATSVQRGRMDAAIAAAIENLERRDITMFSLNVFIDAVAQEVQNLN